jgi:hypothetical protein
LKDLILVERIDRDIANAAGAEITITAPAIGPREVKDNGVGQSVTGFHANALHVHPTVEDIRVNQVRIERKLFGVLPPTADLPVALCL